MTEAQKAFKESEGWIRLAVCVNVHIKKALLGILHNHINHPGVGIPSDPEKLYSFFLKNQNKLKQSKFVSKDQLSALLPQNKSVGTSKFDITLVRFLIQTFCGIKNAQHNWKEPDDSDQTIAAFVHRAAAIRNKIFHYSNIQDVEKTEFEELWSQIEDVLKGLKYDGDVESMKTEDLDHVRCHQVLKEEFLIHLEDYKKDCANESFHDNYIKRYFLDVKENAEVRELQPVLENNDGIIIYAEAGMGKSMCARYIKHKWSTDELLNGYKMIYFNSKLINQHLEIQSNAAPIWFSEMGTHLKKNGKIINEFAKYDCVKATMNNLFVVIDGIDEFPIKALVKDDYLQILEKKILNNEAISAIDTIVGIYFGYFFPNSKLFLLGRTSEFERLSKFKDQQCSSVFDKKNRKDLKLVEFNNENVNQFTCNEVCKNECDGSCHEISIKVKKCELCRVPADLKSLIQMYQKSPEKDIGIITRTKLFISTLFNRLNEHTRQKNETEKMTFQELLESSSSCKLFESIRVISEISFSCFRNENVTINVKEELKDGISYFKFNGIYNDDIYIEREMLEQLDFFYIKNLNYSNYILEPYHLTKMEFLAACFIFSHDKDLLLRLRGERFIAVLSYLAGLHAMDNFTHDFVTCVLNVREYQIDQFCDWLYGIENVRNILPNGGVSWYGLQVNQRLTPSIYLLESIHREHKIPDKFIPKTIVNYSRGSFEWAQLHSLKDIFWGNERKSDDMKFLIKGFLKFDNDKEMQNMNYAYEDNRITFKINIIDIGKDIFSKSDKDIRNDIFTESEAPKESFNFGLTSNSLKINSTQWIPMIKTLRKSDRKYERLTDSPEKEKRPFFRTSGNFKQITTNNITTFDKFREFCYLYTHCLYEIDLLSLSYNFFLETQLFDLKYLENLHEKQLCLQFYNIEFKNVFELPSICTRKISIRNTKFVNDEDLIKLKEKIEDRSNQLPIDSINNYKIIKSTVPFIRKRDIEINHDKAFHLHLHRVNFSQTSPEQFALTMSYIPLLEIFDDNEGLIPYLHWEKLSQVKYLYTSELRVWLQHEKTRRITNLENFLSMKLHRLQLICREKEELKYVLNFMKERPLMTEQRFIKVFIVRIDFDDWDHYDEEILFSEIPIKTFFDNYLANISLLDDIKYESYFEGELEFKHWCCELSKDIVDNEFYSNSSTKSCLVDTSTSVEVEDNEK